MTKQDEIFMKHAISLAQEGVDANAGGPFGCVIVKDNKIIAEGYNKVTSTNDPTAHAEVVAIRKACEVVVVFSLTTVLFILHVNLAQCVLVLFIGHDQKWFILLPTK
tara:strand:- start:91 stop:411 length:321 start_codon:yes stop_codon:yes gene_type:complete